VTVGFGTANGRIGQSLVSGKVQEPQKAIACTLNPARGGSDIHSSRVTPAITAIACGFAGFVPSGRMRLPRSG
jgi:hypothetical protein